MLLREHEILREEIASLKNIRSRLESRAQELEDEMKRVKEETEKAVKAAKWVLCIHGAQIFL
jgi:phage shock protein A